MNISQSSALSTIRISLQSNTLSIINSRKSQMATNLLKIHIQSIKSSSSISYFPSNPVSIETTLANPFKPKHQSTKTTLLHNKSLSRKTLSITIHCSFSSSSPTPPNSKEEAIQQAKLSLSNALQKPLNNPRLTGKISKQKQPRFRVEIPVIDDSSESLVQLAYDIFGKMQLKRKNSAVKILLIWPNPTTLASGINAFQGLLYGVEHVELTTIMTVDNRILNSADVAIFLAPNSSQLKVMKLAGENINPKPLVLFNPKWAFEEEESFGDSRSFVGSFDVVYAFLGLEVRGLLSKRQGVVLKFVRDGVVSGEKWNVFVENEDEKNQLKVVSRFDIRPSIVEVENVLYNLMAVNSPITKSAKFFKDLVSNVTGKK